MWWESKPWNSPLLIWKRPQFEYGGVIVQIEILEVIKFYISVRAPLSNDVSYEKHPTPTISLLLGLSYTKRLLCSKSTFVICATRSAHETISLRLTLCAISVQEWCALGYSVFKVYIWWIFRVLLMTSTLLYTISTESYNVRLFVQVKELQEIETKFIAHYRICRRILTAHYWK